MKRPSLAARGLILALVASVAPQAIAHGGGSVPDIRRPSPSTKEVAAPVRKPAVARRAVQTHTVVIEQFQYRPDPLRVRRGDKVVFLNRDLVPHTATSRKGGIHSGDLAAGARAVVTATKSGTFTIYCDYHPNMTAKLQVR